MKLPLKSGFNQGFDIKIDFFNTIGIKMQPIFVMDPAAWFSPDFETLSDDEKSIKCREWREAMNKLRRKHWFITSPREMRELFTKKGIFNRKCFMCPELLSHHDVAAAFTIPFREMRPEFVGNISTFCLCQTCVLTAIDDESSDISRVSHALLFARQGDVSGELKERMTEIRCFAEEHTKLSNELAVSRTRLSRLHQMKEYTEKERESILEQIKRIKDEANALKKQLEDEKKKVGTDEYKDALSQLRAPVESALEKFREFKEAVKQMGAELETLSDNADEVGTSLKIAHVCKICMCPKDKWITFGCGHVFCQECAALKNDKCSFCNKTVTSWHEVYLP